MRTVFLLLLSLVRCYVMVLSVRHYRDFELVHGPGSGLVSTAQTSGTGFALGSSALSMYLACRQLVPFLPQVPP